MCAQVMINNACEMQEYIDGKTKGEKKHVKFFDAASEHSFTPAAKWNAAADNFFGDVRAMAQLLSRRGLPAADLVLGIDAADAVLELEKVQRLLDKNSGIIIGQIEQQLSPYHGVTYMGTLNFGGHKLNLISVDETYEDEDGQEKGYFPDTAAMVTAPGCGHLMYGQITQIDYGSTEFTDHAGRRVPKFILDQDHDSRKLRLGARPLAAPKNYCPYIFAGNVVG